MKDQMTIEYDGTLLPLDALAINPCCEEDLANLVAHVPICMSGELARMAAWRALGMKLMPPQGFNV
jgi:hypothetical protein